MYRVIFRHHPKKGQEKEFFDAWQKGSDEIQKYPGAAGTLFFKDHNDPSTTYAIATWESKEARDAAMAEIEKRPDGDEVMNGYEKYAEPDSIEVVAALDLVGESNPPKTAEGAPSQNREIF